MSTLLRPVALLSLLIVPALLAVLAGYEEFGRYLALGTLLALLLCVLARPVAAVTLLIPFIYAAAAVTAISTDGVAALIVAIAAGVGAASSRGFHRGFVALLAAALIGSFEPAVGSELLLRSGAMLLGCLYGFVISLTVLAHVDPVSRAVTPQTALSYSVLLSVLVLIAWLTARAAELPDGWWLPVAVATIGEPSLDGSSRRAAARLAAMLFGVWITVLATAAMVDPLQRVGALLALTLVVLFVGRERPALQSFCATPITVLLVGHYIDGGPTIDYMRTTLLACVLVFVVAILGKWVLWTLRPDSGRATA